jgi:hypothetical protein
MSAAKHLEALHKAEASGHIGKAAHHENFAAHHAALAKCLGGLTKEAAKAASGDVFTKFAEEMAQHHAALSAEHTAAVETETAWAAHHEEQAAKCGKAETAEGLEKLEPMRVSAVTPTPATGAPRPGLRMVERGKTSDGTNRDAIRLDFSTPALPLTHEALDKIFGVDSDSL